MTSDTTNGNTQASAAASGASYEINLLDVLIELARRRRFIFLFTCAIVILTAIIVLLIPNKFTAETVILPPGQNSSLSAGLLSQMSGAAGGGALASMAGASLGIKNPADMYVAMFRSQTVEDGVIQHFGLMNRYRVKKMSEARKAFESNSTVEAGAKDGLIRITVTDKDPKAAADFANGYVDQYRNLSSHLAITEAAQRRAFFQQQLLEANENLVAAEEAMKHTQEKTGVLSLDSQARSLIETAAVIRGQIAAKEVELQSMSSYATPDNPRVRTAQQELSALKEQLAQLSGTGGSSSDILLPKGTIPQAGMEYLNRLRDVKYYETIEELISKEFEMAKLDEAREGAIVQVVDVANPPDVKSSPKRALTVAASVVLGFLLACGWVLAGAGVRKLKSDPVEARRVEDLRATLQRPSRRA